MPPTLKLDTSLMAVKDLLTIPDLAEAAETAGFDGLWSSETDHEPFMPLALAATRARRMTLGTSIALSFTRSPMTLAYTCWDLAALTGGRFILGLGTQVKAHNERRFSVSWDHPLPRLREIILGMRAIWDSWRTGEKLNYRGEHYKFTLMTPFFTPPRHQHPIPVTIAGVNVGLGRLAGELCEGFHVHPLHSVKYINEVVRPAIAEGAKSAGRSPADVELYASVFVVTGENAEQTAFTRELARQQISFYASTPSYYVIMETHGWGDVARELSALAARKQWGDMPRLVSDDMINAFAIVAEPDQVGHAALERYRGLLDRVTYYLPYQPGQNNVLWQSSIQAFASQ